MQIKRFEAVDTRTALAMVKKEMGENAVILSTRTVNGIPGRSRGRMEVVAAMDYDPEQLPGPPPRNPVAFKVPGADSAIVPGRKASTDTAHSEASDLQLAINDYFHKNNVSTIEKVLPRTELKKKSRPAREEIEKWKQTLIDRLQIKPLSLPTGKKADAIAMVGTTGSGKTTTAAKLAAWFSIRKGLKVTLLSLDCYRIGATEQLRTYARIMRLPCEIVLKEEDLDRALARHSGQDLIIIDTAGRSPYDQKHLQEMTKLFSPRPNIKPYLVINATAKKEDLKHLRKAYEPMAPVGQIITKLDETRAYATLCQHLAEASTPISGFCFGQRVPEDYIPAHHGYISTLFNKGWRAAEKDIVLSGMESWKEN